MNERAHYLAALNQLKQAIEAAYPYLQINHQKRPDIDEAQRELWMETYHGILGREFDKFNHDLLKWAEHAGLPKERRHEVFIAL